MNADSVAQIVDLKYRVRQLRDDMLIMRIIIGLLIGGGFVLVWYVATNVG